MNGSELELKALVRIWGLVVVGRFSEGLVETLARHRAGFRYGSSARHIVVADGEANLRAGSTIAPRAFRAPRCSKPARCSTARYSPTGKPASNSARASAEPCSLSRTRVINELSFHGSRSDNARHVTKKGSPGPRASLKGEKVSVGSATPIAEPVAGTASFVTERFDLKQLLGEGGMGSVFVAHDRGLRRVVALKRLRAELEGDRTALRRFMLEAQIGAQLEHPNIVPLYSFERTDAGSPVIAMQLLEGQTMAEYIQEATAAAPKEREARGKFALKERLGTLLGVCDAIHFAHERGVVHRDLKPENVMLGQHREVYVMDWGLARVVGGEEVQGVSTVAVVTPDVDVTADGRATLAGMPTPISAGTSGPEDADADGASLATRQGQVMGTPQYMPPEQAMGRVDEVGPAADQFALGVMLLELATLRPARSHTNFMAALSQAIQGQLSNEPGVDGDRLHPALAALVARATAAAVSDRYPSVRAMADDLRLFIRDEPLSVYSEGAARRLVRTAARRPALAMGIVTALVLLAAGAIIVGLTRNARDATRRAHDLEGSRRVLMAVSGRAQMLDVELGALAAGVQAISGATVQTLELDGGALPIKPVPALATTAAFGGAPVSFTQSVVVWPGMARGSPEPEGAQKLVSLERWLRRSLWASLPKAERTMPEQARNAALLAGRGTLLRCFVGLEDGSFTQLPARDMPPDFDVRKRPWYSVAAADPSLRWTRPVVDASGQTLRMQASVGLFGADGNFLGVAGCDLRVSALAHRLALNLPGFQRAYLVTEDGKIAVSEDLEARILSTVTDVNADVDLPAVGYPELAARIAERDHGGYLHAPGSKLIVYSRLIAPAWTYVAELDSAPYLSR